jgi:hypothetical protein
MWYTALASVIGKSHIEVGLPCQDSCSFKDYGDWTISIVSDGAGSAQYSQIGSSYCTNIFQVLFEYNVKRNGWTSDTVSRIIWEQEAKKTIIKGRDMLLEQCNITKTPFRDVSCTLIVIITFKDFILSVHIGDGRAGYLDETNEWFPLITPHKGEEANQTYFITAPDLEDKITAKVFMKRAKAICVMSDGVERSAFEISKKKPDEDIWYDPNKPYKPFFENNIKQIPLLINAGKPINELWSQFLEKGTKTLLEESDDKTLILSIRG